MTILDMKPKAPEPPGPDASYTRWWEWLVAHPDTTQALNTVMGVGTWHMRSLLVYRVHLDRLQAQRHTEDVPF